MDKLRFEYQRAWRGPWHDLRGHIPFLHTAAAVPWQPVIAEMGVRAGMSTRAFLLAARERDGQVYSVDIAPPQVPGVIAGHPRWHFLQADDLSSQAQAFIPAEIDVLFLDAHDDGWTPEVLREHVLAELRTYVPRIRPGGVALLHDTQWQPPATDLGEPSGGVARALDDYCAETGAEWENRPGFYGLGIMHIN